jgi:outer membrane protein OmpA-like peptidoglycan-associated protein
MKLVVLLILLSVTNLALAQKKDTITIYYRTNESSIQKKYHQKLDSLIKNLADTAIVSVEIYGYTDNTGTDAYNLCLSNTRANKVRTYLHKSQRTSINTTCKGMGKIKNTSTSDNPSPENWLFRKVELIVICNGKPGKPLPSINGIRSALPVLADTTCLKTRMANMKIGESFILNNINFHPGSCMILSESKSTLKELLDVLLESTTLKIAIQGHTDCTPPYERAKRLSTERAETIYDYLVSSGVDSTRLQYIGFGNSKPLVKEVTGDDCVKNRRVEIKIIDK